jgi:hypothetical protein
MYYLEKLKDVCYEDFNVMYMESRFSNLGNGMIKLELTPNADLA